MSDTMEAYLRDVRRLPRLSKAEAAAALHEYRHGLCPVRRMQARNRLWSEGLRLVIFVAAKLARKGVPFSEDTIQEGNAAIGAAIESWEPDRGALSTWIVPKVRGAMMDYSLKARTRGTGGKDAPEPIMRSLDASAGIVDDYELQDEPGAALPDDASEYDALDLGAYDSPELAAVRQQSIERLMSFLPTDPRAAQLVVERFGLDGSGGKTASEISEIHGISRAHVHRLITSGLEEMRDKMRQEREPCSRGS